MTLEAISGERDWTEAGPVEVAPGVHRIPLPMPNDGLRAVNVYLLDDGSGRLSMIDGGWAQPDARAALDKALHHLGFGLDQLDRILVTHVHRDHYTLAVMLRREYGIRIGLGLGERRGLETITGAEQPLADQIAVLRQAGADDLADLMGAAARGVDRAAEGWEAPDDWLEAGEVTLAGRRLRIVPTPGHTRGHLVFADEAAGLLFAGDHVLPHITPSIGFEAAPADSPLADFLDSLALVRAMPDLRLLPAHGGVADSTHARIDELLAHHDARLAETADVVRAHGPVTGAEVAAALGWTRSRRRFTDLDPFNRMLAVTETVAHLRLLTTVGTVTATDTDGRTHYS
jgi:glyoxylase-like metal-dependent hydrolase (beta-lactamase superfamily II)